MAHRLGNSIVLHTTADLAYHTALHFLMPITALSSRRKILVLRKCELKDQRFKGQDRTQVTLKRSEEIDTEDNATNMAKY